MTYTSKGTYEVYNDRGTFLGKASTLADAKRLAEDDCSQGGWKKEGVIWVVGGPTAWSWWGRQGGAEIRLIEPDNDAHAAHQKVLAESRAARLRSNKGSPNAYTVDLAQQLYSMWHEKTPEERFDAELEFPKTMHAVGQATHILYESDKWEEDGKYYKYIHKFLSLPTLYASDAELFPEDVASQGEEKTAPMLGVQDLDGQYGFPVLAHVKSLTFDDGQVRRKIRFKSYNPVMSCSVDQRTLLIFADTLLMVHGGEMVVAAPGIID